MKWILPIGAAVALIAWLIVHGAVEPSLPVQPEVGSDVQGEKDARTVATAATMNAEWEKAFDKTGVYPGRDSSNLHYEMFLALIEISSTSPSFSDAQPLRDKFSHRQTKLNEIEQPSRVILPANTNPADTNFTIELRDLDRSYGLLEGGFILGNPNAFAIYDLRIACDIFAPSGTRIGEYHFTIYEDIPAKGKKAIKKHKFGIWPAQGKSIACAAISALRR